MYPHIQTAQDRRNGWCRHGAGCRCPRSLESLRPGRGSAALNVDPAGPVYPMPDVYHLKGPIAPLSAAGKPRFPSLRGLLQLLEALHQLPVGDQVHPTRTPNTKTASPRFFQYHRSFGHGGLLHFVALTNPGVAAT